MFSEQQLREIAENLQDDNIHYLTELNEDDKLSDVSINTEEFGTRKNF